MEFEAFASFDEMMARLQEKMNAADDRVKPWQSEVKKGDHFKRDRGYGFLIYGVVLDTYKEKHLRHYRFCECHSIACEYGERGDVHVNTIDELISKEGIEQARN